MPPSTTMPPLPMPCTMEPASATATATSPSSALRASAATPDETKEPAPAHAAAGAAVAASRFRWAGKLAVNASRLGGARISFNSSNGEPELVCDDAYAFRSAHVQGSTGRQKIKRKLRRADVGPEVATKRQWSGRIQHISAIERRCTGLMNKLGNLVRLLSCEPRWAQHRLHHCCCCIKNERRRTLYACLSLTILGVGALALLSVNHAAKLLDPNHLLT